MLYFDCETQLKEMLSKGHPNLKTQIVFIKGKKDSGSKIKIISAKMAACRHANVLDGMRAYFIEFEDNCITDPVIATKYYNNNGNQSIINFEPINSCYDLLSMRKSIPSTIDRNLGTEENWEYLSQNITTNNLKDFLINEFGDLSIAIPLFYSWNDFDKEQRWLYFLALTQTKLKDEYLNLVLNNSSNMQDFINNIYLYILEIEYTDKRFNKLYKERLSLVKIINDDISCNLFVSHVKIKGSDIIYYLTDNSELEKELILKWLSTQEIIDERVSSIISNIAPTLKDYLSDYEIGIAEYSNYFKQYKTQKLLNKVDDGFVSIVNENATKREYNRILPTRNEIFEKLDKTNSNIYFIDSLGVEFLGFIDKICRTLDLNIDVKITKANLPSTTFSNKSFLDNYRDITIDIKELDELKHAGKGDNNYKYSNLPLHIFQELKILQDILKKIKAKLSKPHIKKIFIVSDHGASRLVVLYDKKITFETQNNGTQGGRCCKYVEGMQVPDYATIENEQCVLASYDRFKTHGAPRVETHGGATLEELVVPIIIITNKTENIIATLKEKEIIVSYKIKAELKIFINKICDKIFIKINNKSYDSILFKDDCFIVPIYDIIKIGEYKAEIYMENKYINDVTFKLIKPIANEKDFGI